MYSAARLLLVMCGQHGGLCGNPEGVYAYNSNTVRLYRANLMQELSNAKPAPSQDVVAIGSGMVAAEKEAVH